mmetsp:Transcript_4922/g.7558  ORF Transcript_4922/g.7558 Transcript_4922/m.7558 type:complete len:102 (+) Transcript_4922:793-1098(+)
MALHNFKGKRVREWILDDTICCANINSGPNECESIHLGLANGSIQNIFIDNMFPVDLAVYHSSAIQRLEMNPNKSKIAVIDDEDRFFLYDISTKGTCVSHR